MTAKDARELVRAYEQSGFTVVRNKHVKIYDGTRLVAVLPSSQCKGRADQNARADLKRLLRQRELATA